MKTEKKTIKTCTEREMRVIPILLIDRDDDAFWESLEENKPKEWKRRCKTVSDKTAK